jgi:acetyltransferase
MASFSENTLERFRESLPAEGNIYNPVDIVGDADIERFAGALDAALSDPNVGMGLVLSAPTAVLDYEELAEATIELREKHDKPVAACFMGGERVAPAAELLRKAGIPNYFDPSRAVASLDSLAEYREIRGREYDAPTEFAVDRDRVRELLARAEQRGDNRIGVEAMGILEAYGVPIPEGEVVTDPAEAERVAAEIDGEAVMKIVSPDIMHKSDIGGVKVGVPESEVYDTYEDLVARARNYQPDATLLGVQVQEMVDLDSGVETIVGTNRDPQFGPLLLFGLGGIFVETLEDVTVRIAPVSASEATEMIDEIDAAPLLRGARGREPVDESSITETIQRLSQLVSDFPEIVELDINPLVVTPEGATAIDIALTVEQ